MRQKNESLCNTFRMTWVIEKGFRVHIFVAVILLYLFFKPGKNTFFCSYKV